jgi:alanine racemase
VDLAALLRNARRVRTQAARPLLPMIKADAYGLGAVAVARALDALDPWGYGVACVAEAEALRSAGIARRLLCFTPLLPDELPRARALQLTPSLHRAEEVRAWAAMGGGAWHLAVDTGMHRAGVRWDAVDAALLDALAEHPPEGAYTHFHSADDDDPAAARRANDLQRSRFEAVLARLPRRPAVVHAENSPAAARGPHPSPWDVVRPGIYLYGVAPGGAVPPEPVAHLRARVVDLRQAADGEGVSYGHAWRARGPRRIATAALGYADGYRRAFSEGGVALLHGRPVPVAGRVTMDMTMFDVTDVPCAVGDVLTLLGRDGDVVLTAADVAARGGLSPYELLVGLRLRVPHLYSPAMPASAAPADTALEAPCR